MLRCPSWEPTDCPESGYFRAKIAQEKLIKGSSIPWSIVRATQFFEFLKGLADTSSDSDSVRLPPVLFQPMAADDVAIAVGRIAVGPPLNGTLEIGGPEQFRLDDLVRRRLAALKDPAKSSPTPERSTPGRRSVREHWFRARTHGSARSVSRPGSSSPEHKFRARVLSRHGSAYRRPISEKIHTTHGNGVGRARA
jgi:uncharacterized protein YbjT (DUF2867 family)